MCVSTPVLVQMRQAFDLEAGKRTPGRDEDVVAAVLTRSFGFIVCCGATKGTPREPRSDMASRYVHQAPAVPYWLNTTHSRLVLSSASTKDAGEER